MLARIQDGARWSADARGDLVVLEDHPERRELLMARQPVTARLIGGPQPAFLVGDDQQDVVAAGIPRERPRKARQPQHGGPRNSGRTCLLDELAP